MTALGFARGRSFRRRLRETASSLEITAGHQRQSPLPLERWRAGIGTGTRVEGLEPSTAGFGARKRPRRPDLCFVLPTPRRERGHQRRSRQPIAGAGRVAGSTDPRELLIPPIRGESSLRSMATTANPSKPGHRRRHRHRRSGDDPSTAQSLSVSTTQSAQSSPIPTMPAVSNTNCFGCGGSSVIRR